MSLTEEDVRRIVRAEHRRLLLSVQEAAEEADEPYETPELESRIFRAMAAVMQVAGAPLHLDTCPRSSRYDDRPCVCDVSEKETKP